MKVYSFWHANFKKGWKGVNLGIWKKSGGYLGLIKNDLRVKCEALSEIWVKIHVYCDSLGRTSNGVVKISNWCRDGWKKLWVAKLGYKMKEEIESFKLSYYGGW